MVPCSLVSAIFLLWKWCVTATPTSNADLFLAGAAFAVAVMLWPLNWIKAMQVTQKRAKAIQDDKPVDQAT